MLKYRKALSWWKDEVVILFGGPTVHEEKVLGKFDPEIRQDVYRSVWITKVNEYRISVGSSTFGDCRSARSMAYAILRAADVLENLENGHPA